MRGKENKTELKAHQAKRPGEGRTDTQHTKPERDRESM